MTGVAISINTADATRITNLFFIAIVVPLISNPCML